MSRLPGQKKIKKLFYFFELLPFANFGIDTCNQDISKIVTASSFIHGQLVKMMSRLPGENLKKKLFYFF